MLKPAPNRVAQPVTNGQKPMPDALAIPVGKKGKEDAAFESLPLLSLDSVIIRP